MFHVLINVSVGKYSNPILIELFVEIHLAITSPKIDMDFHAG